ncbi:MAG: lipopolysaccharide transport periplasmic protein LptA [Methylophilales bacterium BACL14 MAG-120910-bin43]|jgi:lipopolysaccharide export system protein LptA|nr:MAG: lipopolysaccharide transport periplasmic protein LptA [Methylophilales bacterium BACL14 MAG-120910-bin43]KRP07858.1 MAG: lipopolysaccharide transport periplasmic protein LptA [Methylophilales bacterium BACL14 MAG-120920-bin58]
MLRFIMKSLRNSYPGLMNVKNSLPFLVVLLLLSTLSLAEKADRDKPIEIESDTMTMDDTKNVSIYTGDVILTQGTLIIKADELIVREDNQGFQHSTSTGNPTSFKQKREGVEEYIEGIGQRIEYDGHMDKVHIYRNAIVKRGNDTVMGDYIIYDANAEVAQAMSSKSNNGEANDTSKKKIRTKAIINPKKD